MNVEHERPPVRDVEEPSTRFGSSEGGHLWISFACRTFHDTSFDASGSRSRFDGHAREAAFSSFSPSFASPLQQRKGRLRPREP